MNPAPGICEMLWHVPRRNESLPSISLQSHRRYFKHTKPVKPLGQNSGRVMTQ